MSTTLTTGATGLPLPLDVALARMKLSDALPPLSEVLNRVVTNRNVLQDFTPLDTCLESQLSNECWQSAGLQLFTENDVPYAINNNSQLSDQVSETLFRNCAEFEPTDRLAILECGAGTGLFARYLLDAFQARCREAGKDYYDRLTYFVTDGSRRTVQQWTELGLFATHADHVVLGICDAMQALHCEPLDGQSIALPGMRAIFGNYLFDTLPSTVIRRGSEGCEELVVRTRLVEDADRLKQYTSLAVDELRALANGTAGNGDHRPDRSALASLVSCFDYETAFRPLTRPLPGAEEALAVGAGLERVLLNHGALQCMDACMARLEATGFMIVNDYGPVQSDQIATQAVSQRFGRTIATGVNFPLLQHHASALGWVMVKPDEDDARSIHTRLIASTRLPGTFEAFAEQFGFQEHQFEKLPEDARRHMEAGRQDEAMECYKRALAHHPNDWRLLGEIAEFLIRSLSDYDAGLSAGRAALAINPWYSPWLWNVVGDALYATNAINEAHEAYLQGFRIDPNDVRTNLNLAYTLGSLARHAEALDALARGLAADSAGIFRDRLFEKQQNILTMLAAKAAGEQEWLNRRATRLRG